MLYYIQAINNHQISARTKSQKIAKALGWTITISEENIEKAYDGSLWEKGHAPTKPELSYIEKRIAAYPKISDQLDMIYWDMMNQTTIWKDTITEIKHKYPKN